jgi:hypothetical protein
MSVTPRTPLDFLTDYGYGPPLCTQFSVFLENRMGKLLELVELFDGGPLMHLVALSVSEAADYAVVRLVTTNAQRARLALKAHELPFTEAEILVIQLGAERRLSQLCLSLLGAELSIHYAYPLMVSPSGYPSMAVRCDDPVLAGQILRKKGFGIVSEDQLREAAGDEPGVG